MFGQQRISNSKAIDFGQFFGSSISLINSIIYTETVQLLVFTESVKFFRKISLIDMYGISWTSGRLEFKICPPSSQLIYYL